MDAFVHASGDGFGNTAPLRSDTGAIDMDAISQVAHVTQGAGKLTRKEKAVITALSKWCAVHYPSVTEATWQKVVNLDYENGVITTDFKLNDTNSVSDTKLTLPPAAHTAPTMP